MNVSRWSPATRHAILLALATAVTYVTSVVVPQLDGSWLLIVQGVCLVAGAVLTPMVQGYGWDGWKPPQPDQAQLRLTSRVAAAYRAPAVPAPAPVAAPVVPGAAGTEPLDEEDQDAVL